MTAQLPRILSGMQPTGGLHVGNYLGALKNWISLIESDQYEALFCIVDAHAITVDYDPKELPKRSVEAAAAYIAAGLDPDKAVVFIQSAVPEHTELAWYLSCVTPMGDLNRMTQFKEKSEQHRQNVTAGLFTYPILMAADILVYKASVVPVGDDQVQHLELCREIARRFNARFGETLPEPKPLLSRTPRIMGVDGQAKMSKSRGNAIELLDSPKAVEKKIKRAFTDPQKLKLGDPGRPELCNVFTLHKGFSTPEEVNRIEPECRSGALGCGDCKKVLIQSMNETLAPIRDRAASLEAKPAEVREILAAGATRARTIASETLQEVRSVMGLSTHR